jgi:RNA polymerase sigma-70 factor (ECF subfamily)
MDITEVVERILTGDRQAYAQIVTRYQGPLFHYLGRLGLQQARAEDIAQETFLRAWTHLGRFDARRGSFGTWLHTIAHRLALNELGRAATRRELTSDCDHDPVSEAPGPPEALAESERVQRLRAALLELPPRDRAALALACIEDLSLADVARIEGCSVGAIKTRLHRARRRLAEGLGSDDD